MSGVPDYTKSASIGGGAARHEALQTASVGHVSQSLRICVKPLWTDGRYYEEGLRDEQAYKASSKCGKGYTDKAGHDRVICGRLEAIRFGS